ncbi:hypothetical protein [Rhodococcus kronopolitis]|uniref:IPT/TIG domain-containing protein n=1 Tax=Rhodococcus kronopolitis TaxID=1460226 RepID=A0ABV9FRX3_9NOCA
MRAFTKAVVAATATALVTAIPAGIATAAPANIELGSSVSISTDEVAGLLASFDNELLAGLDTASLSDLGTGSAGTGNPGTENPGTENPEPTGPVVTLSKSADLTAAGDTVTVTGSGFSGEGFGLYVGLVQDDKYSATDAGAWMTTKWLKSAEIVDGGFTATIDVAAALNGSDCLVNTCSIYTVAAHGSADRTQDTKTPVTFKG